MSPEDNLVLNLTLLVLDRLQKYGFSGDWQKFFGILFGSIVFLCYLCPIIFVELLNFWIMKNKQWRLMCACVSGMMLAGTASCEKMNVANEKETANVVARVVSFEQTPFAPSTRTAVGDVCNRLNFVVFNTDGERVEQVNQELGDEDFGAGYFNLALGTYQLAIVAHSSNGNPSVNKRSTNKHESIAFTNAKGYTDTFFFTQRLEVDEEPIDLTVNLKRVVAKVRFVNEDAIPTKADSIRFHYTGGSGSIDALTGYGNVKSDQYAWRHKDSTPFEIYTIPWQESDFLDVTIEAYQGSNRLTSSEVTHIPIRRNCITTCRGPLFNGKVGRVTFTLNVDDEWGTPIDYEIPMSD